MTFPTSIVNVPRSDLEDGRYKLTARTPMGLTRHELIIREGFGWVVTGKIETTAGTQYIQEQVFGGHLQKAGEGFIHTGFLDIPATSDEAYRRVFGDIRHIIAARSDTLQAFVVGEQGLAFQSTNGPWKYVNDFLRFFTQTVFGKEWWSGERAKPAIERSLIVQWHDHLWTHLESAVKNEDGDFAFQNTAAATAFMAFAWDLFVTQHNTAFQQSIIRRLKNRDQFQGARYELFVAGACVKAGYSIEFEDESDGDSKHGEFVATYRKTGERILVEAKSKYRPGVLGYQPDQTRDSAPRIKFLSFVNQAIAKKKPGLPLVIFIDLNLPPTAAGKWSIEWIQSELGEVLFNQFGAPTETNREKFNAIVFTNHPVQWTEPNQPPPQHEEGMVMSGFPEDKMSSFEPMTDILHAVKLFGMYPKGFLL